MLTDRERLILLNLVPDLGPRRVRRLLEDFGSIQALAAAPAVQVQRVDRIGSGLAAQIVRGLADVGALEQEQRLAARADCRILTTVDGDYPAPLRTIVDPPPVLYVKGAWQPEDALAVAVVGSRQASLYGLEVAQRLAGELAVRGLTVVSGLARGIDAAAHRGALRARGRTLAVLGSGISRLYPAEHHDLAEEVARQGAVVSEFPMTFPPVAGNFPRRNRLISGLARGVVVVEAGPRSGALITADLALEQGRDVFAVPGPITGQTSRGAHELLKQGARLVTSVEDILDELGLVPAVAAGASDGGPLPDAEQAVLACVAGEQAQPLDTIIARSGLGASQVSAALLQLELRRLVRQLPGRQFVRRNIR